MELLDFKRIECERLSYEQLLEMEGKNTDNIKDVFVVPPSLDFSASDNDDFGHVVVVYKHPIYAFR